MDINELESFKLSDAVTFHKELNPRLWQDEKLDSEVRDQLLLIAEDFVEYLGISNLKVKDVTISGSNAAYSYTPHSDLDLHVLVDFNELPNNEVYQELFTAKKTLYNDAHDITVHGVPVELYVQDINQPVQSLGEFSIVHDKWIRIPKKRRANFDEVATKAKYEKLGDLIELALKTEDPKRVADTIALIKRYRKSGLDKHGEFGPENLAYKAVRKQGLVQALYDLRDKLHTEKLSIEEAASRDDALIKIKKLLNTAGRSDSEKENIKNIINKIMQQWNIDPLEVGIRQPVDPLKAKIAKAAYEKTIAADEFKKEWERFKKGIFAEEQPVNELFNKPYDTQPKDDENYPYDFHHEFTTDDGSKYIVSIFDPDDQPMIAFAQLKDGEYVDYTTHTGDAFKIFATVGEVTKKFLNDYQPDTFSFAGVIDDPTRLKLYDRISQYIDKMLPDYKMFGNNTEAMFTGGKKGKVYQYYRTTQKTKEDYDPNGPPPGPEFKPTMPAGTVRVDVSDVYDWYKLGQHVSNLKGLGKHDFGKGPPSTIFAFGDEDTEHKYIQDLEKTGLTTTDIDPVDKNQPKGMKRQKTDPTYNVNETDDRTAAVLKIQKHLNKKYGANLDLDGKLGPLTLKSINKFMPRAKKGLADEPNKTTAVQGKKVKVDETAQENQIINIISGYAAEKIIKIMDRVKQQDAARAILNYNPYPINVYFSELNLPKVNDPLLEKLFKTLKLQVSKYGLNSENPGNLKTTADYGDYIITLYYPAAEELAAKRKITPKQEITSALVHEIQHALDDFKSIGKVFGDPKKDTQPSIQSDPKAAYQAYLKLPYEVNARFQEAALDIATYIATPKKDGSKITQKDLPELIRYAFEKNKLHEIYSKNQPEYKRLLSRAYKFFDAELNNPKQVKPIPQNIAKRALNWILRKASPTEITEASGYIPSEKEKNDPRFKTALTKDVRPDANKKNAKAFGWKVSRAGIPPQARPDGKIK